MAWHGDTDKHYTYSSIRRDPLPWTEHLLNLKKLAEVKTLSQFNSCLLNNYASGEESMGWHNDTESMLVKHSALHHLVLAQSENFLSSAIRQNKKWRLYLNMVVFFICKMKFIILETCSSKINENKESTDRFDISIDKISVLNASC